MSDLENKRKERSVVRRLFSKNLKELEAAVETEVSVETHILYTKQKDLFDNLIRLDKIIIDILTIDVDEDILENELVGAMEYKTRMLRIDTKYKETVSIQTPSCSTSHVPIKNLNLPKLQLPLFDGEIKNWLAFWGQFSKIDEDPNLDIIDKYQYLLQSMTAESEVKKLVESFPASAYKECLGQLKSRYARKDVLTQIYIREIFALVFADKKGSVAQLYDTLNAQLRALETLDVTKEKYALFLLPMIESALPHETLRCWERNKQQAKDVAEELANLLEFLRKEVESDQRLQIARKAFNRDGVGDLNREEEKRPLTAESLLTSVKQKTQTCLWCDKDSHASVECYKLSRMSIEQRRQVLKEKKACPICLRKGHHPRVCKAYVKCLICSKRHSIVLCPDQRFEEKAAVKEKPEASNSLSTIYRYGETLLQTVIVEVSYGAKKMRVRALFDSGSQRTYIRSDIVQELNIPSTGKELLSHCLFGGIETKSQECTVHDFRIKSLDNSFIFDLSAISQNSICKNIPKINCHDVKLLDLLREHNITLTDMGNSITEIGLLIGADFLGFFLTHAMIQLNNGLVAVKTMLGWTLQGKQVSANVNCNLTNILHCTCNNNLTDYWSLETLGIGDPVEVKSKAEAEADVWLNFKETVKVADDNRYEVQLPFHNRYDVLLPNFDRAKQRLNVMAKKLVNTEKFNDYDAVFKSWLDLGIIEETDSNPGSGHFLPHRPVFKEQSLTSSIRPVFDASAKDKNGLCLNACLEKGINFIELIPNLINNFRKGVIGITSDIEKAFLQIGLLVENRNYLKFLWFKDNTMQEYITFRHCRVVFGLTCSPFLLAATLRHHLNGYENSKYSATAKILNRSFYVDNSVVSVDTKEEAEKFISEAKDILMVAKFNLRMWVTSYGINETGKDVVSVLGLNWNTITDELFCNCDNLPSVERVRKDSMTKRALLSLAQSTFDPIGYTSPVMLIPKLILQETWKRQIAWDDELPCDLLSKFYDWYEKINYLAKCKLPRRLSPIIWKEMKVSLHLFVDASKDGCGACVLLRAEKEELISVQMIAGKSRVTPTQKVTIPRLELMAALLGSRLIANVRQSLDLKCPEYCWTDSGVTLCWIKRELPLKTFVKNRIKEIRENTDINNWYHITGEANWADLASRGCNAKVLFDCRWWEGPAWLRLPTTLWPRSNLLIDESQVNSEMKLTASNVNIPNQDFLQIFYRYFSKYSKIIRMTAWILRFIDNSRGNKRMGEVTHQEYEKAEKLLIRLIQCKYKDLILSNNFSKFTDDEGMIRIKTKLLLSEFPESVQTPFLLPAKDPIVTLLVRQRHEQLQHAGYSQLIADTRTRFWIIGIRRLVKSVIFSCVICRRFKAKPTEAPTAPLPIERVTCSVPFQTTGVDLAGPLYLRDGKKCWVVLYTCAVYRAVHLEITKSLSTEDFIMSLRRFIARRGRITMLNSDQGTNFHGTKNLLSALDWDEIQKFSTVKRISWKMNAPSAAWWGGYWERLIRIMKDLLRRILGKAAVSYDELLTILCDCEAVMNGRPLTFINDDSAGYLEPLTPAHFIQPISNCNVVDFDTIDAKSLNTRLKYVQELRDHFRQRFKSDYLTFLVQKGKEKKDIIDIGDVVLLETDEKRVKWPLAIVEELFEGKDGVKRTARVRTSTGVRVRPVQRLYKLEIPGKHYPRSDLCGLSRGSEAGTPSVTTEVPVVAPYVTRSGRKVILPSRFNLYL